MREGHEQTQPAALERFDNQHGTRKGQSTTRTIEQEKPTSLQTFIL